MGGYPGRGTTWAKVGPSLICLWTREEASAAEEQVRGGWKKKRSDVQEEQAGGEEVTGGFVQSGSNRVLTATESRKHLTGEPLVQQEAGKEACPPSDPVDLTEAWGGAQGAGRV